MLMDFYETSITGILLMRLSKILYQEDLLHHPLLPAFILHTHTYIHMSHRGGLQQYFYSVHALGIIHQQQSWFGAIC